VVLNYAIGARRVRRQSPLSALIASALINGVLLALLLCGIRPLDNFDGQSFAEKSIQLKLIRSEPSTGPVPSPSAHFASPAKSRSSAAQKTALIGASALASAHRANRLPTFTAPATSTESAPVGQRAVDVQAAMRRALRSLTACSVSMEESASAEFRTECARRYRADENSPPSTSFINPIKRADFDKVAEAQEQKRASLIGPIHQFRVPCTGRGSNMGLECAAPKPREGSLWDATAKGGDRGGEVLP
jgi:hypothetical protein